VREKELGPDPLDVDADSSLERFEGRKGGVRATLMNQQVLAGIGNTYSDEILFQAQLHPRASVAHLGAPILGKLHTEVGCC
jgi:formamidopyrimidine-DNA glycosylase